MGTVLATVLAIGTGWSAVQVHKKTLHPVAHKVAPAAMVAVVQTKAATPLKTVRKTPVPAPAVVAGGPWTEPTFADSTIGDRVDGEDIIIRRAAVEALGSYNGSVVAVDPTSGRILAMVNQRIATSSGFQPCSTIKVSVALAGLSEKVIQPAAKLRLPEQ